MSTIFDTIQVRRGTAEVWTVTNPVLNQGEFGFEYNTGRLKVGDGLTHWVSLPYYPAIHSEEWIQQNATFTYLSGTQFTTPGNVASSYPTGIRVKGIVSAGTIYGTVTNSGAGGLPTITTVTVAWDAGLLDSGLSTISIGIFSPLNSSVPPQFFVTTGIYVPYGGDVAPIGWLMCFGQSISRTTYANLFAVIGTKFGSGNGSTTFNVPDFRGRTTVGADNMGGGAAGRVADATAVGYAAGVEKINLAHTHTTGDHALSVTEMPAHSHNYYKVPSSISYSIDDTSGAYGTNTLVATSTVGGNAAHNHGSTGSALSSTQEIMNPYLTTNWIIRY